MAKQLIHITEVYIVKPDGGVIGYSLNDRVIEIIDVMASPPVAIIKYKDGEELKIYAQYMKFTYSPIAQTDKPEGES